MMRLITVLANLFDEYRRTTPKKLKLIDAYMFYIFITGVIQFIYCVLVGTFPFNSFLSGFVSTIGCFVLAASLRIQVNPENKPLFPHIAPERAFADFIFAHVIGKMDHSAKKAREEYLKKYLSKDKQSSKKHKKKKKKTGIGLKIHENDAFVDVAPRNGQTSSDDESDRDIEIVERIKKLHSVPKFKPAAFEVVELKTETDATRKQCDSSFDQNVTQDEISLPTTSVQSLKSASVGNKSRYTDQEIVGKVTAGSDISLLMHKIKSEPLDSDASPPRRPNCEKRNSDKSEDHSFSKRKKSGNDLGLDVSSPCRRIKDESLDSDASPPRRPTNCAKRNSNDDVSDASSPRRKKPADNSDSDLSPPRKRDDYAEILNRKKEFESYRRRRRKESGSSIDSYRQKRSSWNSDASSHDENVGKKRQKHYERSREESSSSLHRHHEDHRRRRDSSIDSGTSRLPSKRDRASESDVKPMNGRKVGAKTLETHREEMMRLQENETKLLKSWKGYTDDKNVATIRRGKLTGKGRESKSNETKEREAKKQKELEEKYKRWNKGIRQLEERSQKLNEMARVAQEDFARHVDDKAMNEHLKEQLRAEDPMYKYVKKKKEEAETKSGNVYPKYNGSWPPNRFNIAPGYRWDGVNRSNGFEDRIAEIANKKVAQRTEYYENIAKYESLFHQISIRICFAHCSFDSFDWLRLYEHHRVSFGNKVKDSTMEILKKLIAKKYTDLNRKMASQTSSVAANEGSCNKILSENSQLVHRHEIFPSSDSDLKTAIEMDGSNLDKKLITSGDVNKSTLSTNSINSYKRSISPDTMLRGATSNNSNSPGCNQRTSSLTSDYSSDLSFFGMKSSMVVRTSNNTLVEYWWDLTPQNIHTIVINYLYDSDNRRCNQCWTFFEGKLGISRVIIFYILIGTCFLYILSGDLAKLLYYITGIGYPMYKTYATYEHHGLHACRIRTVINDRSVS
ncbi:BUD13 [Dirofilaria immitis]